MNLSKSQVATLIVLLAVFSQVAWGIFSRSNDIVSNNDAATSDGQDTTDDASINGSTMSEKTNFTLSEIAEHNTIDDCWSAIEGSVYDLTPFINGHPGGPQILKACGVDGSQDFRNLGFMDDQAVIIREMNELPEDIDLHSENAKELLEELKIVDLAEESEI